MLRVRSVATLGLLLASAAALTVRPADAAAKDQRDAPEIVAGGGLGVALRHMETFQPRYGGGYSLDYSADGKWMATGGVGGDIVVWDAASLEPVRRWHPFGGPIELLDFSPDGERLVTGGPVVVWDPETGRVLRRFRGYGGAAWDPQDRWLAQGGEGEAVVIRDATTYAIKHVVQVVARTEILAWSPDGTRLAAGTARGQAIVIDPTKGTVVSTRLLDDGEPVYAVAFLPDGRLVAASRKGRIRIGDREIPPHMKGRWPDGISRLAISPDGTRVAFGHHRNGTVRVRDAETGEVVTEYDSLTAGRWIGGLSWSPDGKTLSVLPDGGALRAIRGDEVLVRAGNATEVRAVTFDPSGRWAAAAGSGCAIIDLEGGGRNDVAGFTVVGPGRQTGEVLAAGSKVVAVIDAHVGDELERLESPEDNAIALRGPWVSPDGHDAVMGGFFDVFHVSLQRLEVRELDTDFFRAIDACWAPDSRWGALAQVAGHHGEWKAISVFRRQDDGLQLTTKRTEDTSHTVAVDATGKRLVAGGSHGLVSYDPETLEETGRIAQKALWFRFLTGSLGLADTGAEVVAVDLDTGESATLLRGDDLRHAALSRDGQRLIVGSRFAVWVYDVLR